MTVPQAIWSLAIQLSELAVVHSAFMRISLSRSISAQPVLEVTHLSDGGSNLIPYPLPAYTFTENGKVSLTIRNVCNEREEEIRTLVTIDNIVHNTERRGRRPSGGVDRGEDQAASERRRGTQSTLLTPRVLFPLTRMRPLLLTMPSLSPHPSFRVIVGNEIKNNPILL